MLSIRRASERGHANHGWLDSRHTFSFAGYHDPRFMGFRDLRVINEDRVQAGQGFGTHAHDNMEIISYVLDGELQHKDSLGTGSVIRRGDVQRMSAGTGVRHSEFNPSKSQAVHFLQIWILPDEEDVSPSYEQRHFPEEERRGRLRLLASKDGGDGALRLHQDVRLYATVLKEGEAVEQPLGPGRYGWVQVARGRVELNGKALEAGDGAALSDEPQVRLKALGDAEVLVFDLP